jgi:hypothetical protein
MKAALVALLAAAAALAGCAGGEAPAEVAAADRPELAVGRGAIAGLLVDDRYRPLHLTDQPAGEYDVPGFILVVETGEQLATDAEGLFSVLDLAPGSYTLRPAVERHEGAPQRVEVLAGQYAEVDLLVRRVMDAGRDTVIVHDDTLLITCSVQVLDGHFTVGRLCHGDVSGEEGTNWVDYNYTEFGPIAAVVVEARSTKPMDFEVWLTRKTNLVDSPALYGKVYGYDSDYIRVAAANGTEVGRFGGSMLDAMDLRVWTNVNGPGTQEADQASGLPVGADFTFVAEVRIVVSAFLEMPEDLDTYALLD